MGKLRTWFAMNSVAIGFIIPGWPLFSDNPKEKKPSTCQDRDGSPCPVTSRPVSTGLIS